MRKLLVVAFVIGSFSSGTYSTSIPKSDSRYDRDILEAGSPPAVEEYLQNLYNYRPQTTVLEEEADYRSYHNNFNPIGPVIPTPVNSPAPALDNEYMESRSRDNYNHYQPLRGSHDRDQDHRGDRRPFPPNPPYLRDPQRAAVTRAPRPPAPLYQDDNDDGQGLPNNFQDPNQDDADYNFSDVPDDDDVESDPPFPNVNPSPRYNPNYNQRPPNRRPAQASCGGGSCGGGGGGKLPKPPGNLYDDQTGRERGDPSYRFGYDLHDQSRHENADRFGNVNGYFSFVDDEGTFNKVSYSAGAAKGFIVNHKEPADPPAAQPPQRTRAPNIRRNPNSDVGGGGGGGGTRRNSNHASSYPPRQHHNPFGNKQHNTQNIQNQLPNTLNLNSNNNNAPPLEDEVLSDGVGNVVGLPGNNKGGGGGREGPGGDGWSRNKIAGVGTSTVVTTATAASGVGVGANTGNSHNNHSPHNSSDDPSSVNLNGTSDGNEPGNGDGGDGRPNGPWGSVGGNGNRPNQRPRQRKRKPAYVVKVKRPANNNNVPAWQYYKPPNPGRPAPGGGDNGNNNNNNNWQHNQNNRPLPPQGNLPHSQDQDDLDGSLYDGSDGSDGSDDYDPYPKDKSYSFGYKTGDSTRQEASDAYGNIRGSYSYVDPAGLTRVVHYSAGNSGFKILNAQPSNLHPVYADSPLTVQSLQSIPIPVAVTSQLSQLRQPSAIVYHIHPDNGLGSEWKPWESARVKSVGPVYHHNSHRSRTNHQLAPLISASNPNPSNKRSRSPHRSRERSQKQQILQGNTFRLTHQNHRFFPAYNNIYDQAVRQNQLENVASASEDITFSPAFQHVNPDDVETIIGSNVINNGLDNSADIETNQQNLKQVQRQQIRQQNKLRRLSQQYQQQIISTPVFQYSRRHPNQSPRFNSPSSRGYYYRDRLEQYPSIGNDNEILWRPQDQQYSDYELSPSSIVSQSNALSVNTANNSSSSNSSSPSTGTGTGRGIISTFPNSNSSTNPNLNRRRSSRERGQKRSSISNVNRNSIGNIRDKSVGTPNNLSSSSDSFVNGNNANSNRNSNSNLMNITEILTSPGPGSVLPHDVPPPSSSSLPNPIPTPPMTQQPLSLPITMAIPVSIEGGPGIQTYQGGYGDKNPLLVMSQRSQSQSRADSSERGHVFFTGPRLQREIPLRTTQSMNSINNPLNSVPVYPSLIPAVETDLVAMPIMPMGIVVSADNQMAESIINSVMATSSSLVRQGEYPGSFSSQNPDVGVPNLKLKTAETEESEAKPESSLKKVKTESEPIVRMSPAARLAAKMASPPSSSISSTSSPALLSTSTFSSGTEREGTPSFSAIALPMTMSNSGMVGHYPGGKTELGGVATVASSLSKEMMMMTA